MVGAAKAGLFESLPGSLYSLLVATHSVVRTSVMGKFLIKCQASVYGGTSSNIIMQKVKDNKCNVS